LACTLYSTQKPNIIPPTGTANDMSNNHSPQQKLQQMAMKQRFWCLDQVLPKMSSSVVQSLLRSN
jgi:hypothetical protein